MNRNTLDWYLQKRLEPKNQKSQQQEDSDESLEIVVVDQKNNHKKNKQSSFETFMNRKTSKQQEIPKRISDNFAHQQQDPLKLYRRSMALGKYNDPLSSISFKPQKISVPIFQPHKMQAQLYAPKNFLETNSIFKQPKTIQSSNLVQYKNNFTSNNSYTPSQTKKTPIYKYEQNSNKIIQNSHDISNFRNYSYTWELPEFQKNYDIKMGIQPSIIEQIKEKGKEQRRIKRQKQKQEKKALAQKRKKEQEQKKMQGFSAFMDYVLVDKGKDKPKKKDNQFDNFDDKLRNLDLHQQMLIESQNKIQGVQTSNRKINTGLIYKKRNAFQEKIPYALLRILLSFKFSTHFLTPQRKKVPNFFTDQMLYKKIFHYLVTNQCLADLHLRMKKIEEDKNFESIPIEVGNYFKNADGLVQIQLTQIPNPNKDDGKRQEFMLKNLWLSKNRLGIVSNLRKFQLEKYGIQSKKNDRCFGFLCFLQTPETKEELNGPVKGLASFEVEELDMIFRITKSKKAYFYDIDKISTHIRQYLAITHLYQTQIAPLIYNPELIDKKQYEVIQQNQRHQLEPILEHLSKQFNKTQFQSIREMVVRDEGIVLLQGPPGTGKTTTLMGLLAAQYHYLKFICPDQQMRKILICAPSNAAIDHITKRLVCEGLASTDGCRVFPNILRVGIVQTEDPDIRSVSLDDICDKQVLLAKKTITKKNNMTPIQIKQKLISLNKEINQTQLRNRTHSHFDNELKIKRLKQQARQYQSLLYNFRKEKIELKQIFLQEEKKLFDQADIILTTLSSSGSDRMEKLRGFIGCLIVDEAAQSTQPNILIPLQSFVKKVLLIGDPCQLPSTTLSQDSQITLFNRSLFERFIDAGVKPYFLNIQYRMAPPIRQFASNAFYGGRLLDDESIISRYKNLEFYQKQQKYRKDDPETSIKMQKSPLLKISKFLERHYFFVDVKFCQEQFHMNSYRNIQEASVVSYLIYKFMKNTKLSIGVITPYQSQRKYLMRNLLKDIQHHKNRKKYEQTKTTKDPTPTKQNPTKQPQNPNQPKISKEQNLLSNQQPHKKDEDDPMNRIMINTVDSFQGQEKDIIIVSTVRANNKKDIGFMKDQRRINVALTRAKHLMIVVGNGDTLGSNQIWDKLLSWNQRNNTYYSVDNGQSENCRQLFYRMENNRYDQKIERKKHTKKSKDWRKFDRNQIKGSDFGLKVPSKKIKLDRTENHDSKPHNKNEYQQPQSQIQQVQRQKQVDRVQDDVQKMMEDNEKWMNQKKQRQNEAMRLQQMNKRLKQLQSKMALQNSAFAQLFK